MYNTLLEKFALFNYFALLIVGVVIPSDGQHTLLNLKSLFFLSTYAVLGVVILLRGKLLYEQFKLAVFMWFSLLFLTIYFGVGQLSGMTTLGSQLDQMKLFLVTILFVLTSLFFYREETLSFKKFLKVFVYANFFYSTVKIIFVALIVLKIISIPTLIKLTGIRVVSMSIVDNWERFQTSMDLLTPFLIFFVLAGRWLGVTFNKKFVGCYLILSLFGTLISFSRVFIFIAFVSLFLYNCLLPLSKVVRASILGAIAVSMFVVSFGPSNVVKMIEVRLFSYENQDSDSTRNQQVEALVKELVHSPAVGIGLGGYVPDVIRDDKLLHSYEVQWVAFAAQFGFLGLTILSLPLFWLMFQFLIPPFNGLKLCLLVLLGGWVLAGFTNPFLISLSSGIVYSLFALVGAEMNPRSKERGQLGGTSSPLPKVDFN